MAFLLTAILFKMGKEVSARRYCRALAMGSWSVKIHDIFQLLTKILADEIILPDESMNQ